MTPERIEFLISQHVDGTISADDSAELDTYLAADPDARLLVHEYQKLDTLLRTAAPAVPMVDYDRLGSRINERIDDHNAAPSFRLPFGWGSIGTAIAVAACAMIAVGIWLRPTGQSAPSNPTLATNDHNRAAVVQVAVLQPEDARLEIGPALQRIAVGPPADRSNSSVISEAMVTRPNTLFIAKADAPAQDTPQSLY
jgi:anti-sigma factor RsiW